MRPRSRSRKARLPIGGDPEGVRVEQLVNIVFAVFVLAHGFVHLMGFAKAFELAELPQLKTPISRPVGLLWAFTALCLIATSASILFLPRAWWALAVPSVLLSEVLIILSWDDAKLGTVPNLVILAFAALAYRSLGAGVLPMPLP